LGVGLINGVPSAAVNAVVPALVVAVAVVVDVDVGTALVVVAPVVEPIWKNGNEGSLNVLAKGYEGPMEGHELDNDNEL
jgi:hypothetical protein